MAQHGVGGEVGEGVGEQAVAVADLDGCGAVQGQPQRAEPGEDGVGVLAVQLGGGSARLPLGGGEQAAGAAGGVQDGAGRAGEGGHEGGGLGRGGGEAGGGAVGVAGEGEGVRVGGAGLGGEGGGGAGEGVAVAAAVRRGPVAVGEVLLAEGGERGAVAPGVGFDQLPQPFAQRYFGEFALVAQPLLDLGEEKVGLVSVPPTGRGSARSGAASC